MGGRKRSSGAAWAWLPVVCTALTALMAVPAAAQAKFDVELRVEGKPAVLEQARGSFTRALEALPDVEVVDSLGDWKLLVLAADMRSGATALGVVVGATLLEVVDGEDLAEADPEISSELEDFLQNRPLGVYKNMWVYFGGPDDMGGIARQVAAEVDASVLAPCRVVSSSGAARSSARRPGCRRHGGQTRPPRSASLDAPSVDAPPGRAGYRIPVS